MQLSWKCTVLQMVFSEFGQHLQNSYFKELFLMYEKQESVEYLPSSVLDFWMLQNDICT